MQVFKFSIEGNTDKDGDGAPDVTATADIFGFKVLGKNGKTINIDLGSAMILFSSLVDQTRKVLGIKD